jgi:cyclophilin family peptidyl-prolyl cis-trans isomerase
MTRNFARLPLFARLRLSLSLPLGAATLAALVIACGNGDAQTSTPNSGSRLPDIAANEQPASPKAKTTTNAKAKPTAKEEKRKEVADSAIQTIDEFIAAQSIDTSGSTWKTDLPKPPKLEFDASKTYYWELDTNVGNISIRFLPDTAPMHVSSAIYLTRLGFFDGLTFHRVIPKFMAQGGDPLGNGRGGPGYRFEGEYDRAVRHDRPGLLSQANAGPGTDGSQFFITFVATPHLDGKHTLYGEVVEGMDAVKQLEQWRERGSTHMNEPLLIERAEIRVD